MQEMKELAFMCIAIFYMSAILIGIIDSYVQTKKRQARIKRQLIHYKWKEARFKCIY